MLVERFLKWQGNAPVGRRAEAADALVRAFLYSPLSPDERGALESLITVVIDDIAPVVRLAVASALAGHPDAPGHVVRALAEDQPRIAGVIIENSPVLSTPELAEIVRRGDPRLQSAVARRCPVPHELSAALAEFGDAPACLLLLENEAAVITRRALDRVVDRHGGDADIRHALLSRDDLPLDTRQALVSRLSRSLVELVTDRQWLGAARADAVTRDARDRATIALGGDASERELAALVARLIAADELSPGLLIRALADGNIDFVVVALAALSGQPRERVASMIASGRPSPIRLLFSKAGLPLATHDLFVAAMAVLRAADDGAHATASQRVSALIEATRAAIGDRRSAECEQIVALLRRIALDARRQDARTSIEALRTAA